MFITVILDYKQQNMITDGDWSCADICDRYGDDRDLSYPESFLFRHFTPMKKFYGQIRTVSCLDDNSKVKEILATDGKGMILVVDGNASMRRALMGDIIAESAVKNNWKGVIINGVIRDSAHISKLDTLGVLALGTNPRKTERRNLGSIDVPVSFAGIRFQPNDWIYVDEDGFINSRKQL